MGMRTHHVRLVYKTIWTVALGAILCAGAGAQQTPQRDARIEKLFSSDAGIRAAAKADLLQHPDPALLPALLKELPSSKGTTRADLLDILAKYNDPRKIPVFFAMHPWEGGVPEVGQIDQQLADLGQPTADALVANCTADEENYWDWAGGVLSWMHGTGARTSIEAVLSDNACKHKMGEQELMFTSDADEVSRADTQLASNAVIDPGERIRSAARQWFATWKGKEDQIDCSGIVEVLIAVYQKAPAATMVKIAQMLSEPERPRVTRFMRAAVHSPNPEIQKIANDYLALYPPANAPAAEGNPNPQSPEAKIKFIKQVTDEPADGANEKIVPLLSDADANVRAAGAAGLGELNAPLMNGQETPDNPDIALTALRKAAKDPSPQVRAAAVGALGDIRSNDDADLVVAALKDSDATVQLAAVTAVQEIPNDAAVPAMTQIYRNTQDSAEMREQALVALKTICSPNSTPLFLEALQSGNGKPSLDAAEALACTLGKQPQKDAFAPILKALQTVNPGPGPQDSLLESSLMDALAATKNPEAFEPLAARLKSQNRWTRQGAAGALAMLGDRRAIPVLAGLLQDPDNDVWRSAAAALTRFSDFPAPPELIATLNNPNSGADANVLGALVASHDPKAIDAMIAAMPKNPSTIYWLGKAHDTRAVPALIAYLQNPANDVQNRATAATSLGELGNPRAVEPLIASLSEDNVAITMQASAALGMLKDRRAIEPLKQAYARWSTGQRQNAETVKVWIIQALQQFNAKSDETKPQ